jgi:hypothetical protein
MNLHRHTLFALAAAAFISLFVLHHSPFAAAAEPAPHPRIFHTDARIAALKERIATEKFSADAWAAILAQAEKTLREKSSRAETTDTLSLAWRMTGDRRFAEKIRAILLREIRRDTWADATLMRRTPPWHSGLGSAYNTRHVVIGYDAIFDFLTIGERREIAAAIARLGIEPALEDWISDRTRIHALDTMGHNWWSCCVGNAGIAALAILEDEPRAASWVREISGAFEKWLAYSGGNLANKPATFDRAGGFYESVNYANFGIGEYLYFLLARQNALGTPPALPETLIRTTDFFIHASYPNTTRLMSLNFGDGNLLAEGSRPLALLWALGQRSPDILWYLRQTGGQTYREGINHQNPFGIIYLPSKTEIDSAPPAPSLPRSALFSDMGWTTLRDSWSPDATLLAAKCGFTWNHAHADAGSFILFHRGENLIIDSGNCNYARSEYDSYYRQSAAHNVVLFNGEGGHPEDTYIGSKFDGSMHHLIDTGSFRYFYADATGPNAQNFLRNYRHFVWLGDVILIIDDLLAFKPGQFEWLLHTGGETKRNGLDLTVRKNDATILVRPLFPAPFPNAGLPTDYPENMRLIEKTGLADHAPDTKTTYYAFAPSELTRRTKFITAIILVNDANKNNLPKIERIEAGDIIGVRIGQNGETTDLCLNLLADGRIAHRNSTVTLPNGWQTDALLTAVTRPSTDTTQNPDTATRLFIAEGSYLRDGDGAPIYESLSKAFLAAERTTGSHFAITLQGQPLLHARLRSTTATATLNGAMLPGTSCDSATKLLHLVIKPQ